MIATGARPDVPSIPGLSATPYWTSTETLTTREPVAHLIVIGASVVALELAHAFLRLGSRVTLLARTSLLSREDTDVGTTLEKALLAEGMVVRTHITPTNVAFVDGVFRVKTSDTTCEGDKLLVATGRSRIPTILAWRP